LTKRVKYLNLALGRNLAWDHRLPNFEHLKKVTTWGAYFTILFMVFADSHLRGQSVFLYKFPEISHNFLRCESEQYEALPNTSLARE
jgi:hypothetical protein